MTKAGLSLPAISEAAYEVGYGIKVTLEGNLIRVGSHRFMAMESIAIPEEIEAKGKIAHEEGHSFVYLAINEQLAGAIELVPTIRPEAAGVVDKLRQAGMEIYIISGDHERPTRALAEQLGIEHYAASLPSLPKPCPKTLRFVSPWGKADLIRQLQEAPEGHDKGKSVCFVGDGINDGIALKKANVSVSLRGASTIATDTAQVILMDQNLSQLQTLFDISEQFEANMRTNLMTTVVPGVIITGGAFSLRRRRRVRPLHRPALCWHDRRRHKRHVAALETIRGRKLRNGKKASTHIIEFVEDAT